MALFKINRGGSSSLPQTLTDGWAYFCTDTGEFFIDYTDAEGVLQRKAINAQDAKTLGGVSLVTIAGQINKKVDKVDGMGLSKNDFTDDEKEKLAAIPTAIDEADVIPFEEYTPEQIQQLWDSITV